MAVCATHCQLATSAHYIMSHRAIGRKDHRQTGMRTGTWTCFGCGRATVRGGHHDVHFRERKSSVMRKEGIHRNVAMLPVPRVVAED